ncbi:MAG TPA: LLM class flavin-dependent oxidoreductase [Dehalococcoidia bacterium]|nr:LLM class flavin-dependent oxidoreductase [Dehalococcoidia bacterium]
MKLGLLLNVEYPLEDAPHRRIEEHVEQVRAARRAGFDLIGVPQHYSRGASFWFSPIPMAARIVPELGPMRLGLAVLLLPLYHPVEVAEQVTFLDAATDGRFVFGAGLGWVKEEFAALGVPMEERGSRFEEGIEILRRLWRGETVRFAGRHYALEDVRLSIPPSRSGGPPIWIGGNSARAAIRRAARLGDVWILSAHPSIRVLREQVQVYEAEREAAGLPLPDERPVIRNFYIGRDYDAAVAKAKRFYEASYQILGQWGIFEEVLQLGKRQARGRELEEGRLIAGGPEECLEQIDRYRTELGATLLILRLQWLGMPNEDVLEAIQILGEEVIPRLASAG